MKPRLERKAESLQVFDFIAAKAACPYMRHVYKLFKAKIFRNTEQKSLGGGSLFLFTCVVNTSPLLLSCVVLVFGSVSPSLETRHFPHVQDKRRVKCPSYGPSWLSVF